MIWLYDLPLKVWCVNDLKKIEEIEQKQIDPNHFFEYFFNYSLDLVLYMEVKVTKVYILLSYTQVYLLSIYISVVRYHWVWNKETRRSITDD